NMFVSWRWQAVVLAFCCSIPLPARASLTTSVEGLEPALNAAWAATPLCSTVKVDGLLVRDDAFALTTTSSLVLRLSPEARGTPTCSAQHWNVTSNGSAALRGECAKALCSLLDRRPELAGALFGALERERREPREAPLPVKWSPPKLSL